MKNAEDSLEKTVRSVSAQSYGNIEHIVVDGASTDGTLPLLERLGESVDCWVSERDGGVYYGMNRGIDLAAGDWICFLNAGDTFAGDGTVEDVFSRDLGEAQVVYGDHIYGDGTVPVKADDFETLSARLRSDDVDREWLRGFPCHHSVLARAPLMKRLRYDTSLRFTAEQDFLFRAAREGASPLRIDLVVSRYEGAGESYRHEVRMLFEQRRMLGRYGGGRRTSAFFAARILDVLKTRLKAAFTGKAGE